MKKKKAGTKDTDAKNQEEAVEGTRPAADDEQVRKADSAAVKIEVKTDKAKNEEKAEEDITESGKDQVAQLKEALASAEKEKEAVNDRFLRAAAEFDNYKKRLDRQWIDFKKYANESMAKELLTVVDNMERAIAASSEAIDDNSGLVEGVKITLNDMLKILNQFGVTPLKAAGEKFDPNYHQAISTRATDEVENNIVLEEYQKGYMIHDRLLRPAMVIVSAASGQKDQAAE